MFAPGRLLTTLAAAMALTLAHPGGADAQSRATAPPRQSQSQARLDAALREFGFDPARLRPGERAALDEAWRDLLPDSPRRYELNRAQATAIVYLALVHGRGGGRWGDRFPAQADGECRELAVMAYDLGNAVHGPSSSSMFIQAEEKEPLRARIVALQREALRCGNRRAADHAGAILELFTAMMPLRSDVAEQVDAIKDTLDGRDRSRRDW